MSKNLPSLFWGELLGDITCRKCGEPWDSYGVDHGDMTPIEAKKFKRGEGCPSCNFGRKKERLGDHEEEFLESLTTETDEDPIALLDNVVSRNYVCERCGASIPQGKEVGDIILCEKCEQAIAWLKYWKRE